MILNIVTSVYLFSIIVMAFWTNIRAFCINDFLKKSQLSTQEDSSYKTDSELGSLDIIVVINLVMVSLVGK